jgi:hypothetical protein
MKHHACRLTEWRMLTCLTLSSCSRTPLFEPAIGVSIEASWLIGCPRAHIPLGPIPLGPIPLGPIPLGPIPPGFALELLTSSWSVRVRERLGLSERPVPPVDTISSPSTLPFLATAHTVMQRNAGSVCAQYTPEGAINHTADGNTCRPTERR